MKHSKFMKATVMLFTMILFIGSTFAADISFDFNGDNGGATWTGESDANDWDNFRKTVSAYIYMDVLDDDGDDAAYLSVTISRSYYGRVVRAQGQEIDAVQYSARACVYVGSWEGRANARVIVTGIEGHDRNRDGAVDIGGEGNPSAIYASKSTLRDKGGINVDGNRKATASASVWHGGISAGIELKISGF